MMDFISKHISAYGCSLIEHYVSFVGSTNMTRITSRTGYCMIYTFIVYLFKEKMMALPIKKNVITKCYSEPKSTLIPVNR